MSNKTVPKALPIREGMADTGKPALESPRCATRAVALLLVRHQIRNLRRWFEEFDRDILLPILLGEIALHNIGVFEHDSKWASELSGVSSSPTPDVFRFDDCRMRPCNAYSIAAATDLPRETVRRKIGRLVDLGWIERRENGHLFITEAAIRHFGSILSSRELVELMDAAERARKLMPEYSDLREAGQLATGEATGVGADA